ncbi:pyridoxal phosphate-dependent aminotransferase [bacterium]|nr:pyridoxal phosphate-dependent aminotransferase [bacterium]
MIKLSNKARAMKPSPTLAVMSKAKAYIAKGIDVINFGVGEPDFNTPEYIKDAGIKAIKDNFTRYTPTPGIVPLREAICKKFKDDNGLDYEPSQILVSPGAKASIVFILMAICDAGDQVIVPSPYWVSYPDQVDIAGGRTLLLETTEEDNFKIDPNELKKLIADNPNVKALMLNNPNNPTGAIYSKDELIKIGDICLENNILIIADEIYEKLVYDGAIHYAIAALKPEFKDITVIINGVSKAYAMTGWRLGYSAGPKYIIDAASSLQGHITSNTNSMTQKATVAALLQDDGSIEKMRQEFELRKDFMYAELNKIDHVSTTAPQGAFYIMVNVDYYLKNNIKSIKNDVELCSFLLEEAKIAIVPGSAFGNDKLVRFSYANSMDNLREGVKRFAQGLKSLL